MQLYTLPSLPLLTVTPRAIQRATHTTRRRAVRIRRKMNRPCQNLKLALTVHGCGGCVSEGERERKGGRVREREGEREGVRERGSEREREGEGEGVRERERE